MLRIAFTTAAEAEFDKIWRKSAAAFVEIDTTLGALTDSGLAGELLIAVVNHRYDVHLLGPANPAPSVLVISDPQDPSQVCVAGFPSVSILTAKVKHHLAGVAASEFGLIASDIHVVP